VSLSSRAQGKRLLRKMPWGDDKNEPLPDLPEDHETEPDINGIKTITTYRKNELGQTVKVVQKVKVSKRTVKVSKSVLARRQWDKFGACKNKPRGYHGMGFQDSATTTIDISEQSLEMNPKEQIKEENNESAQRAFEKMNAGAFEAWRPKQRDTSLSAAKSGPSRTASPALMTTSPACQMALGRAPWQRWLHGRPAQAATCRRVCVMPMAHVMQRWLSVTIAARFVCQTSRRT